MIYLLILGLGVACGIVDGHKRAITAANEKSPAQRRAMREDCRRKGL